MSTAVLYAAMLAWCLWNTGASFHGWSVPIAANAVEFVIGLAGTVLVGRAALNWLALPRLTLRGCLLAGGALLLALATGSALGLMVKLSDDLLLVQYRDFGSAGLWLALLSIAVLTPIFEEWLFRGAILELLLSVFTRHTAVIVTALLFAFMHLSPLTVVHHSLLGYVCGRVRLGTGSLWPAIGCHAAYNAVVVLANW